MHRSPQHLHPWKPLALALSLLLPPTIHAQIASQNFETWPDTGPVWTNTTFGGWTLTDGQVRPTRGGLGVTLGAQSGWLNDFNATSNSWIQGPYMPHGVASVTFQGKRGTDGAGDQFFEIRHSADGTNWTTAQSFDRISDDWTEYSYQLDSLDPLFIRIVKTGDQTTNQVLGLDNIFILPPDGVQLSNLANTPNSPSLDALVHISVIAEPATESSNVVLQARYRFGTNGAFTAIAMTNTAGLNYQTISPIPAGFSGIVQYYVHCTYDGFGPSPIFLPTPGSNSPAYYDTSNPWLNTPLRQLTPSNHRSPFIISEIMYNPAVANVTNSLIYIELFNTEPVAHDLGGYSLAGDVSYTFPLGTKLAARAFAVIAADPAALQSRYALTNVFGPMSGGLPNNGGSVLLKNREGAQLLDVPYDHNLPWPIPADGGGHALVLAFPDYGEASPNAWHASRLVGGSPGNADPVTNTPIDAVVINEFLAHTDLPEIDYIELFNTATQSVDISGCTLSDSLATNKFTIPPATILPPLGFILFTQTNLNFSLSRHGDEIVLGDPAHSRIITAIRFPAQINGVSMGRYPDGAAELAELGTKSPGTSNIPGGLRNESIVINEIMYHPLSGSSDDEYVELLNKGTNTVYVGDWRFITGIDFTIPPGTTLAASNVLVIARNVTNLLARYPQLSAANTIGNFSGKLSDSGESLTLARPDDPLLPAEDFVIVDELAYNDGDSWGAWADGGGSSLELVDPRADNRLPMNWAGSDETAKSQWTTIDYHGSMDNGVGPADELRICMLQAGECLLDNVVVKIPSGTTYLNETFEAGLGTWLTRGNHTRSTLQTTEGFASSKSLHIRASGAGIEGTWNDGSWSEAFWNRVSTPLSSSVPSGTNINIQARIRWLAGWPNLTMVVRGFWAEAATQLRVPSNLGSPGLPNSRYRTNTGPAISEITHTPILPASNQPAVVSCRVHDPDGLSTVTLYYRLDPATNQIAIPMTNVGAGRFAAAIPAQPTGTIAAFVVRAVDAHASPQTNAFPLAPPLGAPALEGLVQFGQITPPGVLGTYTMWLSDTNVWRWSNINPSGPGGNVSKYSNEPIDLTFVIGADRVIYNAGARFRGLWRGYGSPVDSGAYSLDLPKSEPFMGENEITIDQPGQTGGDATRQVENYGYSAARQIGLPASQIRFVRLFVNGTDRGIQHDLQTPGPDFATSWYGDGDPNIYKMYGWMGEPFEVYRDGNNAYKQSRYRWNLKQRRRDTPGDDYTPVFDIAAAAAITNNNAVYAARLDAMLDLRAWMGHFAVNGALAGWDTYGWQNAHNGYFYIPHAGGAGIFIYDMDYSLSGSQALFPNTNGKWPVLGRMINYAPFRRVYLSVFKEMANGPMASTAVDDLVDPWYVAFLNSGKNVTIPSNIKFWVAGYRASLTNALLPYNTTFAITSGGGTNLTTTNTIVTLTGTAPVEVDTIRINGIRNVVTYTTVTNWSLRLGLPQGTNALIFTSYDWRGTTLFTNAFTVVTTQPAPSPLNQIVISEIMYHPPHDDTDEYVELFNRSTNTSFDLRGWRLNGADLIFDGGSVIAPRQYAVAARSRAAYQHTYGNAEVILGNFSGALDDDGETLSLQMPAGTNAWTTIDQVTYDDSPPWSAEADGGGQALQLIDPNQDNNVPGNWSVISTAVAPAWKFKSVTGVVSNGSPAVLAQARLNLYLQSPGTVLVDRVMLVTGTVAEAGANRLLNSDFETALSGPWARLGNHSNSFIFTTTNAPSGTNVLALVSTAVGGPSNLVLQATNFFSYINKPVTLSYWYFENATVDGLTVEMSHSTAGLTHPTAPPAPVTPAILTPGTTNTVAAVLPELPPLFINEVMPSNVTAWADNVADFDPWIEIYNAGTSTVALAEFRLSNAYTDPGKWAFPSGLVITAGSRLLIWADAETNETAGPNIHASFRLNPVTGCVVLARAYLGQHLVLDALDYNQVGADFSYGDYPEGNPRSRQIFHTPTPGTANIPGSLTLSVVINEWMSDNKTILRDPTDLQYDDWFELFNPSAQPVNLGGYYLTDNLAVTNQFSIPGGTILPPGAFLLVWADNAAALNGPGVALHTNFRLSNNGEAIGLFKPDGTLLDAVTFAAQSADRSEGSWPNGTADIYVMAPSTPGASNAVLLVTSLPPSGPTGFAINWITQSGSVYNVYGATNLIATNWITLGIVTASSPTLTFTDTNAPAYPTRFYRLQRAE